MYKETGTHANDEMSFKYSTKCCLYYPSYSSRDPQYLVVGQSFLHGKIYSYVPAYQSYHNTPQPASIRFFNPHTLSEYVSKRIDLNALFENGDKYAFSQILCADDMGYPATGCELYLFLNEAPDTLVLWDGLYNNMWIYNHLLPLKAICMNANDGSIIWYQDIQKVPQWFKDNNNYNNPTSFPEFFGIPHNSYINTHYPMNRGDKTFINLIAGNCIFFEGPQPWDDYGITFQNPPEQGAGVIPHTIYKIYSGSMQMESNKPSSSLKTKTLLPQIDLNIPNPCPINANIKMSFLNFKGDVNISIYDVLGRRVKTCLMNVTDSNRKEININLKPGVYIFKSVTKDKKIDVSKKFVVI